MPSKKELKDRNEKAIRYLNKRAYADKELTVQYVNRKEFLKILEGKED